MAVSWVMKSERVLMAVRVCYASGAYDVFRDVACGGHRRRGVHLFAGVCAYLKSQVKGSSANAHRFTEPEWSAPRALCAGDVAGGSVERVIDDQGPARPSVEMPATVLSALTERMNLAPGPVRLGERATYRLNLTYPLESVTLRVLSVTKMRSEEMPPQGQRGADAPVARGAWSVSGSRQGVGV